MPSLRFTPDRHGLLFVGECGRMLHAEAGSAEEQARWLALLPDEASPSCDEMDLGLRETAMETALDETALVMRDETLLLLVP